ncbi:3-isopropylmalate dehydratase [Rhodococcus sp. SRB_17]|nr:3-isopropylmalate dehydratase [Rhodococcus sp. SRB_17]
MGMTTVEKIFARKTRQKKVSPGDLVTVEVDTVVMIDNSFNPSRWREIRKLHDPRKVVVVFDHRVPAPTVHAAIAHRNGRKFVERFGIERVHDVGFDQGISHQLVFDNAYGLPGTVLVCSDSHTCSAGVLNCLARGVGEPDVMYSAIMGETWFRVGETIRYELYGKLSPAVAAKDAFLQIAGQYCDHANQNVEYGGPGLATLSLAARKTLTTMSAELSAEFAVCDPDDMLLDYVRSRTAEPFEPVSPDADANYLDVRKVDLGALQPLVAFPDTVVDNSRPVSDAAGIRVDQAFIGSCANGTLEDLQIAARVLQGRRVAPGVRLIVTPGSQQIYREALRDGTLAALSDAGAIVTPSTCGACGGGHLGVLGPNETCITASTRNFKGRMGDSSARIYMGSPATVAASAVRGTIADPREFLE